MSSNRNHPEQIILRSFGFDEHFREPESIVDCLERIFENRLDLQKIQYQMNDKHRQSNLRLGEKEFVEWKKKAAMARSIKMNQNKNLERWAEAKKSRRLMDTNIVAVLSNLVELVNAMQKQHEYLLSESEKSLIGDARNIVDLAPTGR
jgi:hypothetical protein